MKNDKSDVNILKEQSPKVSIYTMVFNHKAFLKQCLDGIIMQQTDFAFEALIHDDCSSDGSIEIIKEYAEKYPNIIKPIYETENQYSKYNGSITRKLKENTNGIYVAYCEGDDYWTDPFKLQKQVDILDKVSSVTFVYSGFKTVDETGKELSRYDFEYYQRRSYSGFIFPSLLTNNFIMTVSVCMRKEVLFSDYVTNWPYSLDYLNFLSASLMGKAYYLKEKTCSYRKVRTSATNIAGNVVRSNVIQLTKYFTEQYLDGNYKSDRLSIMMRIRTNCAIVSKGIDMYIKKQERNYLKNYLKKYPHLFLYVLPGLILELYLLVSYYSIKQLTSKDE